MDSKDCNLLTHFPLSALASLCSDSNMNDSTGFNQGSYQIGSYEHLGKLATNGSAPMSS